MSLRYDPASVTTTPRSRQAHQIRLVRVNTTTWIGGEVTLLAGDKDGQQGHEEGQGTSALFNGPSGVAVAVSQTGETVVHKLN